MNLAKMLARANENKKLGKSLNKKHHAYINKLDEHSRHQFALILASVLTSLPSITDLQTSLFQEILDAFNLGDVRGSLFEDSRDISFNVLREAVTVVKDASLEKLLLVDCLVLLLSSGELSSETKSLIGELADFMGVDAITLSKLTSEADEILGFGKDKFQDILEEITPGTKSKRLTEEALSEGISGGLWYIDKDLKVTFPWQADDAIFVFERGASLLTDTDTCEKKISGEMKITGCKFVNASLVFHMDIHNDQVSIDQCEWQGEYLRKDLSTVLTIKKGKLSVRNSKFVTPKACAIHGNPFEYKDSDGDIGLSRCKVEVENCEFVDCGHIDMEAGAVIISDPLYDSNCTGKIINSTFLRCRGKYAGALYAAKLDDLTLTNCEFISCESPGNDEDASDNLNSVAVYIEKAGIDYKYTDRGTSHINNCTFRNTSLRINDYQTEKAWLIKDSEFYKAFVFLPRTASWSSEDGVDNCKFIDGRVIELR